MCVYCVCVYVYIMYEYTCVCRYASVCLYECMYISICNCVYVCVSCVYLCACFCIIQVHRHCGMSALAMYHIRVMVLLSSASFTRIPHPWASGDSAFPTLSLSVGALGLHTWPCPALHGFWRYKLRQVLFLLSRHSCPVSASPPYLSAMGGGDPHQWPRRSGFLVPPAILTNRPMGL